MKTTYLSTIAVTLSLAGLTVSCDGCDDKKVSDADGQVNVTVETDGIHDGNAASGQSNSATSGTAKSADGRSGNDTKAGTKKNGYSAADGTNDENNDGDMYTKNDTTPQASGPPIK